MSVFKKRAFILCVIALAIIGGAFAMNTAQKDVVAIIGGNKVVLEGEYVNNVYGFSFNHPKDFVVTSFPSGDGSVTVLVQNQKINESMQVVISPFDEEIDITETRLRQDIPNISIENAKEVKIASERKGLSFASDYESFGAKSSNIWFVYRGNLYQLSAPVSSDSLLQSVFKTWKFK